MQFRKCNSKYCPFYAIIVKKFQNAMKSEKESVGYHIILVIIIFNIVLVIK
jgi:hypothetical protein